MKFKLNRKLTLFLGLIVLSVLSIVYLVTRSQNPANPSNNSSQNTQIPSNAKINLPGVQIGQTVAFPNVPAQLNLYNVTPVTQTLEQVGDELGKQLGLSKTQSGPVVYWTNDDQSKNLNLDPYNKRLNYKINYSSSSPYFKSAPSLPLDKLATNATNFLQSLNLDKDKHLVADTEHAQYFLTSSFEMNPANKDKANIVKIPFNYQLDGVSFYTGTQTDPSISVFYGGSNTIVQIDLYLTSLYKFSKTSTVTSKTFDELKADLNSGNFQVLNVLNSTIQAIDPKVLANLLIENISLQYRVNANSTQASPYFLLTGSQNGTKVSLVIPAFK